MTGQHSRCTGRSAFRPVAAAVVVALVVMIGAVTGRAQDAAPANPPADPAAGPGTYEEIQKMIENLENRVGKVGEAVPAETLESLEKQVDEAVRLLTTRNQENQLLRGKAAGLSDEIESMAAEQEDLSKKAEEAEKQRDQQVAMLEDELAAAKRNNAEKEQELERMGRQLEAVVKELATLSAALEKSEDENQAQEEKIAELDGRLARAMASKVEEMARYRSEFFGKLRAVLGERQDVRIVGDRFVFQSEVLFASGEAVLGEEGKLQLERFAATLAQVANTIPSDVDWVLRVDGHTDRLPIHNERFASNWELSTARAVSVVKFLIEQGIPANRLVAAGFGEYQPLDTRFDEIAFRRNRRIEFKLTQK